MRTFGTRTPLAATGYMRAITDPASTTVRGLVRGVAGPSWARDGCLDADTETSIPRASEESGDPLRGDDRDPGGDGVSIDEGG